MRRATFLALVLVLLAACGVPTHQKASKVDGKDVPFGLLDQNSGSTTANGSGEEVSVYFAKDGRLVASSRRIEPPVTPERLLDVLNKGPTKSDITAGLRSALPESTSFDSVSVDRGTVRVDLARPFTALSSTDQTLALAQLVYTLTGRPGIGSVRFTLQGATTEVPRANGSLTSNRVSREDYLPLGPTG